MPSSDLNHLPMQFKVKHKLTFDSPDNLTAQMPRSHRKTKTMLKSFRSGHKDSTFLGIASTVGKDQNQMKSLVQSKIQQLHERMKSFFSNERKTHLQQIAPQMQEIANSIIQLKQQLNRPKSMAEIQEQKHELLRRKVALLQQIEQTNKKVKENKLIFYDLKFETQQLDRQLKNGHATILKYKTKLQGNQSKLPFKNHIHSESNQIPNQNDQNMQKILNESLCEQNIPSPNKVKDQIHEPSQLSTQRQNDHVHITEVIGHGQKHSKKEKTQGQNLKISLHYQTQSNQSFSPLNPGILKQNQGLNKSNSLINVISKNNHQISGILHNQLAKLSKKTTLSNSSFDEYLKFSTLLEKKSKKSDHTQKYTKSIVKNSLQMSSELRKYEEVVNKQKWKKIGSLFAQLQSPPPKHCLLPKNDNSQITQHQKNQLHINDLEELLMDELRKEQFQSFKEKGYHEGLKDKTHQIKIEMKRIFKNYSPDEFFESIINKKPIKKQLAMILEDSFN